MCENLEGVITIHFLDNIIICSQNSNSSILHPINIFRVIDHKDKANPAEKKKKGILKKAISQRRWGAAAHF